MSFLTELIAFVVTGNAKYGSDYTPLDKLNDQAEHGLDILNRIERPSSNKQEK